MLISEVMTSSIDILSKWHFECTYLTKHSALKQGTSEPFVEERITRWTECSWCNSMKRSFVCSSILSERPHSPLSLFNIPSLLLTDDMILSMINTYCQFILGILFNEWCPKDPGTPRQIVWNYYPLNRSLTRVKSRDASASKKWRGMYIMCIIV